MEELKLNTIEEAIADFREGKFVIVVDDEDRVAYFVYLLLFLVARNWNYLIK